MKSAVSFDMSSSVSLPGLAEVDEPDPIGAAEHEDVGRMGIAVEDPVPEDHRHPGLGHHVREPTPLVVRELLRLEVDDLRPLEELERQHPRPGVAPEDAWHAHVRIAGEVPVEGAGVASLLAVVELLAHRAGELVDEALRVDEVERADAILCDLRRLVEQRRGQPRSAAAPSGAAPSPRRAGRSAARPHAPDRWRPRRSAAR